MRVVLDTNLLVSGAISAGPPRHLLDAALARRFVLCTSDVLLEELSRVLVRAKFSQRFLNARATPQSVVEDIRRVALIVAPADTPRVVARDPDDDHVLVAAVVANADLIASGDKRDLLALGHHGDIAIVTAVEALRRIREDAER